MRSRCGKMYVIGGFGYMPFGNPPGLLYEYDPGPDKWTKKKIFVAGGEVQNERYSAAFRSLESYDPVANRWDILPSLPGAVHGNAVAFIGNRLHTVSGKMEGGGFADAPGKATADHSVMEMPAGGTQ